ncbi:group II intron maturase-specific domain-containing protein [Candidatus Regiella insecticola]|uniref:group II intron maturase-specific domain-containing protein n=1 Tax=Candidatus Regiella insecticola TaxID=138073 RepID=UPI003BB76E9B
MLCFRLQRFCCTNSRCPQRTFQESISTLAPRWQRPQPIDRVIYRINPILRGWVNYYRIGNSSRCFTYVKDWIEKKARRHLMKARRRQGFGWGRWSREGFYQKLGLYSDYKIRYYPVPKVSPAR